MDWNKLLQGFAYLFLGSLLKWLGGFVPAILFVSPWIGTFLAVAGVAAIAAGALTVFDVIFSKFYKEGILTDLGKLLVAAAAFYTYEPIKALGPIAFAAIVFAFLVGALLKK